MKAYRFSVNFKLGLIVLAAALAVGSLAYSNRLVDRLRDREQSIVRLWAAALEQIPKASLRAENPVQPELQELSARIDALASGPDAVLGPAESARLHAAVRWAQSMPPAADLSFILDEVLQRIQFGIPAIVSEAGTGEPLFWHNVSVDSSLADLSPSDSVRALRKLARTKERMAASYPPIPIVLAVDDEGTVYRQVVHYGDSALIRHLRWFPLVQLAFAALVVVVGYLGFSYIRRSEQSNLWVGMAKEAAHQLGTPISSLMGWTTLLADGSTDPVLVAEAAREIEKDVERLTRVTSRFSDIGSMPRLERVDVAVVVAESANYMRRRMPEGGTVTLDCRLVPAHAALNTELFQWVVENLLKNALDALEGAAGHIEVEAGPEGDRIVIDVSDTGRGIERGQWKNVFRPGYSTKARGWGLGLSLARRIVEDYHGGSLVLLRSKVDQGTTFRITLPAAVSSQSS